MADSDTETTDVVAMSVEIVAAYVSHNSVSPADLPKLITEVHAALAGLGVPLEVAGKPAGTPFVPVKRSVSDTAIICLEDGLKFKSLKRHLIAHHNLTPDAYRARWGLPSSYPMVAPAYSAIRSRLAKSNGLGRKAGAKVRARKG